ncbi:hypothetical protein B0T19DRAFT_446709 [Cercophora scortea]|uniref:Clr5 domain-containing protein n=1 Tax=Cercophora scortea TaxID=314031 RepID=A0AAE0I560_9PEZI|nr:hypothetical protein B0T19DRAFT_446709 [Cercophora scortea]
MEHPMAMPSPFPSGSWTPEGSQGSVDTASGSMKWAKPLDWVVAKPTIKQLYIDEKKTLKQVMAIMEIQHNFYATPKMYKSKFKQWNISKSFKPREVLAVLQAAEDRQAAGKASRIVVRGKEVDLDWVKDYIKRKRAKSARVVFGEHFRALNMDIDKMDKVICRTPSPSPQPSLKPPAALSQTEELLHTVSLYINGAFSGGQWFVDRKGCCRSRKGRRGNFFFLDLWDRLDMASNLMDKSEPVDLVNILNPAFVYLNDIIREEDPRSFPFLLGCFEVLRHRGRTDLMGSFLRYTAQLAARILGPEHPHSRIWKHTLAVFLSSASDSNDGAALGHSDFLEQLYFLLLDRYKAQPKRAAELEIGVYNDYCESVLDLKDLETQESTIRRHLATIEADYPPQRASGSAGTLPSCELAFLRHRHATAVKNLCLSQGRFQEAEEAMDSLREHGDWDGALALQNRGDVRLEMGDFEAAEGYFRAASGLVDNHSLFRDEGWIGMVFEKLEEVLERRGQTEEAREVRRVRAERVERLGRERVESETAGRLAEGEGNWMTETRGRLPLLLLRGDDGSG